MKSGHHISSHHRSYQYCWSRASWRPWCSQTSLLPRYRISCLIPFCCRGRSTAACTWTLPHPLLLPRPFCSSLHLLPLRLAVADPIRSYWLEVEGRDRQSWLRLRLRWRGRLRRTGRRWLKLPLQVCLRNRRWEQHNAFWVDELSFHLVSSVIRNLIIFD